MSSASRMGPTTLEIPREWMDKSPPPLRLAGEIHVTPTKVIIGKDGDNKHLESPNPHFKRIFQSFQRSLTLIANLGHIEK
jgi:hypothetical protein